MKRRQLLAAGCAHCAALGLLGAGRAAAQAGGVEWAMPQRFARPEIASDEGGLWAMMDREETRLRRSPFVMRDPALRQYLQGIACKLGGSHCQDTRVYPVRTPFFNASMAPNGMMQVWSGLLLRVENEAQLAGVIGHELGHYLQRHLLERLRDLKARSAFGAFMSMFGLAGLVVQMASLAGAFAFSRDHEREADRIGLALMRQAGYDPREAAKVWANLLDEMKATPGGDPSKTSPLFATHPASEERSQTLAALAEGGSGFLGEAEYVARIAPFLTDLLDDELARGQHGETLILLDRMVARRPEGSDLLFYRAETRRLRDAEGDADAALADLHAAIRIGGEPARSHRALGYIHRQRGQTDEARAAFTRYVERAPGAPDVDLIRSYLAEPGTARNDPATS
ncbi:MAG: M48 family metallopeptidase [Piscinibacter sp.]|nr:M48 family metallopeptidase [Piscinibacter sp.]